MQAARAYLRRFAVHAVLWRNYLDWAVANVPFYLLPILSFYWTVFFFFFAAPARRSVVRNFRFIRPGSSRLTNHLRAFRTLFRYAQTIGDAANFRIRQVEFDYEIEGADYLEQLAGADGAILLTAHMGSYDVGAALFARKFDREIRMVRAPEPDAESAQHLTNFVQETGRGAVKIAYNTDGALLAFDLLQALRKGEIVSIQGDRVAPGVAEIESRMFDRPVQIPSGPFTLALVAEKQIFPLFIVRAGHYRYRIIVRAPFSVSREQRRDEALAAAAAQWCSVLENVVAKYSDQWFAFAPIFSADE